MNKVQVLQIKENVLAKNEDEAKIIRNELNKHHVYFINVMSSPGSGKTTLLVNLINRLTKKGLKIGVLEADIDGEPDVETILNKTKAKAIQIHTGGACHMTAQMTKESIEQFGLDNLDLVFLENIGNLVCPAEFDVGANKNMMLLSVPEGDDKPLKYPLMFEVSQIAVITKIDTLPVFDFSFDRIQENIHKRNPNCKIFKVSAKKDIGVDLLAEYLYNEIQNYKSK